MGSLAGIITAYNFRKEGPQAKKYDWGSDEENELIDVSGDQHFETNPSDNNNLQINYTFKENENPNKS
ncbi:MAG: hypothetical protein IPH89_03685 [Bacteroidetes bacterium]|nr:hypothetical protein [Bacteroidota bacterium]